MRHLRLLATVATLLAVCPAPTDAQQTPTLSNVFLDCQAPFCDFDHFRREIEFVNWVRDREDGDAHVLVTAQRTGGGGWEFTLAFLGRRQLAGRGDTLRFTSRNTDTEAEIREGLTQTLALGLVPFAARTAIAGRLRVGFTPDTAAQGAQVAPADDPWNFWTFRVGLNASIEGEAQQFESTIRGSASASRTTEHLKIQVAFSGRRSKDEFELEDTTIVNITENYSGDFLTVWSLGRRWSAGVGVEANRSTFSNRDLAVFGGPALEFNIFPYDQSTRQRLSFLYRTEVAAFNYDELTVEGELSEILPRHRLSVAASVQQPWGRIHGSVSVVQYLHDPEVHRIDSFASTSIRIFRGLSVNVFAQFSRIKDQFFLPAAGLTPEEVLLRRRQRETDFRYDLSVGFSYRFGSTFANIVNPRMGEGGFFF